MSDMTDLFMRDPLDLTNEDIDAMIEKYREARKTFKAAPSAVKAKKEPKLTAAQQEVQTLGLKLDL